MFLNLHEKRKWVERKRELFLIESQEKRGVVWIKYMCFICNKAKLD